MTTTKAALVSLPSLLLAAGCADVLGLNDFKPGGGATTSTTMTGGSGGATTTSTTTGGSGGATTSSTMTGGAGGATTSSTMAGGSGGATTSSTMTGGSGGASVVCTSGEVRACAYGGPAGTEGVGPCKAAKQVCAPDGMSFGACDNSQVLPATQTCGGAKDENCDGLTDCVGNYRWGKIAGDGASQSARGVAFDPQGNVVVVGELAGTAVLGGTSYTSTSRDLFVWKLDRQGKTIWSKAWNLVGDQAGTAVAVDEQGAIAIVGTTSANVDFGGGALAYAGGVDVFFLVLEADGTHRVSKLFGSPADDIANGVAVTASGHAVIGGSIGGVAGFGGGGIGAAGDQNAFAAKVSMTDGAHAWSKSYGGGGPDSVTSVAVGQNDSVLITGNFANAVTFGGTSTGSNDLFIAKLDSNGSNSWYQAYSSMGAAVGTSVVVDTTDQIYFAGYATGDLVIQGGPLGMNNVAGAFVAKFGPAGGHKWSKWLGNATTVPHLAVDAEDNVIVAAEYTSGAITFGGASFSNASTASDWAIGKLFQGGNHVWSRALGDAAYQQVGAVAAGPTGDIAIVGASGGSADFGGGPLGAAGGLDLVVTYFGP